MFRKAERKKSRLRLAIMGTSGAGKTYSALLIAKGIGGRIAMIDTEMGSGELYSHLCDYDVCTIAPPFEPKKYIQAIKEAEKEGYNIIIIDSLSHAWAGEGGLLDMQSAATLASKSKNSYMAWREVTPQHNRLVDTILQSSMHVIATLRSKTEYTIQDVDGRKQPVKIGLAPVFRDGIEYEFTACLDLSVDNHLATATKDRTSLFDGKHFIPSEDTGRGLFVWFMAGKDVEPRTQEEPREPEPVNDNKLPDGDRLALIEALEKATNKDLNEMGEIVKTALGEQKKSIRWTREDAEKIEQVLVEHMREAGAVEVVK